MIEERPAPPWRRAGWRADADGWIDAHLTGAGLRRIGAIEQPHERAWSTVLRVPTSDGPVFFKETAVTVANDATVTALLAGLAPDLVMAPIVVDGPQRRMLLPDAGPRLREELERQLDMTHWERILPRYAELQRIAAPHAARLLAAGAHDRRLERLPAVFAELLADPSMGPGTPRGLSDQERETLGALAPRVSDACAELATIGAETIQHDDLHDGNVHRPDAGYRILDWGDAVVSHPFGTLLVTERSVAARFGLEPEMPELARLRAAYLEPWTDLAPSGMLQRAVELAIWVGLVSRALTWREALSIANDAELVEWEGYPADTLRVLTEA
jgi:hypothetical protein